MNFPHDRKYTTSDEWVKLDGNVATIGISDYAQEQLSDIVFWESTVTAKDHVDKGAILATVESVKAAGDVNCPASGEILAFNEALEQKPETINTDPFGEAWMLKIKLDSPGDVSGLMDAAAYQKYCEERSH